MLVHGEQAIRLHGEIPPEGTVSITTTVAGMYDKGSAGVVVLESESRHADSGELAFTNRTALLIRGAGGFGGRATPRVTLRATWPPSLCQGASPTRWSLRHPPGPGTAVPAQRRP